MSVYVCAFERVGRNRSVPDLPVETATDYPGDEIAEAVYRYSRRFLGSKWFDVTVDLEAGTGSIEAGRFGRFSVAVEGEPAPTLEPAPEVEK